MLFEVGTVSLFFAILAVIAQAYTVAVAGLALLGRVSDGWRALRDSLLESIGPAALWFALGVAAIATAGSLYFSEVAHFPPCKLCWYQRIAMYPLVPILALAALKKDYRIAPYVALVAGLGSAISIYHVLIERFPALDAGSCDPTNPCTVIWVNRFGYLTIPTMALSGFWAIVASVAVAHSYWRSWSPKDEDEPDQPQGPEEEADPEGD
jgi:disulfide bond formation protein DsbB